MLDFIERFLLTLLPIAPIGDFTTNACNGGPPFWSTPLCHHQQSYGWDLGIDPKGRRPSTPFLPPQNYPFRRGHIVSDTAVGETLHGALHWATSKVLSLEENTLMCSLDSWCWEERAWRTSHWLLQTTAIFPPVLFCSLKCHSELFGDQYYYLRRGLSAKQSAKTSRILAKTNTWANRLAASQSSRA